MPKKRQHLKSFKPTSSSSHANASSSASGSSDKPQKSVNELLANLRRTSIGTSSASQQHHHDNHHHHDDHHHHHNSLPHHRHYEQALTANNTPTVPPALREILQIPETPAPAPRRPLRSRYDGNGRRLPAGPPPPRSWVSRQGSAASENGRRRRLWTSRGLLSSSTSSTSSSSPSWLSYLHGGSAGSALPGVYVPERGSLIDIVLQKLASDWGVHRIYNQYYLYFLPNHLKPALIRLLGVAAAHDGGGGVSLADLDMILHPPPDMSPEDLPDDGPINREVTCLDLAGSIGSSLKIKELSELLFPSSPRQKRESQKKEAKAPDLPPQDSWDDPDQVSPSPSPTRALLPNLTHLSLAVTPETAAAAASWKQLLAFSAKLPTTVTHLSLAYWPDPCFTPRARFSTVTDPQGRNIPYGGTNYYSHTIDHDWSEALLVLRMLSRNLYELEFLDLTGCSLWFKALTLRAGHDYVDWAGTWGKISVLRLYAGWKLAEDASIAEQTAYQEAVEDAEKVEKHIRAARAGRGRIIDVERNRIEL